MADGYWETYLELILVGDSVCCAVVDRHSSLRQSMLFLKRCIHQVDGFARLGWTLLQCLLEQVSCSFNLGPSLRNHDEHME